MSQSVGEVGEFGLIERMRARLPVRRPVLLGPGDDAAVIGAPDGRVVATTDLLLEGVHFRRDWSTGYDVGRKAAAQNLADIAAMGAVPTALVVGLVVPADLPAEWAEQLSAGLADECAPLGASVAGGDTVRGEPIVVAVTALGDLRGAAPVLRSGARAGDVIAVAGRTDGLPMGASAAGLALLRAGLDAPDELIEAHRRPKPPYDAGPEAVRLGATALMDVSDGLLADLGHIARDSDVRIGLRSADFDLPPLLHDAAKLTGEDPLGWALTGGEDHVLVAAFPPDALLPARWRVIGDAVASDAGVVVDGRPWEGSGGFSHFG